MKKFILPLLFTIILIVITPSSLTKYNAVKLSDETDCSQITEKFKQLIDNDLNDFLSYAEKKSKEYNDVLQLDLTPVNFTYEFDELHTIRSENSYNIVATVIISNLSTTYDMFSTEWRYYDSNLLTNILAIMDNNKNIPIHPDINYIIVADGVDKNIYSYHPYELDKTPRQQKALFPIYIVATIAIILWLFAIALTIKNSNIEVKKELFVSKTKKSLVNRYNYLEKTDIIEKSAKSAKLKLPLEELFEILKLEFEKERKADAKKLYDACAKAGISGEVTSKSNIERIALIAKKNILPAKQLSWLKCTMKHTEK